MTMTITKEELSEYNKVGKQTGKGLIKFVEELRASKTKAIEKPKSEREELMEMLDAINVEYKKNAKTEDLRKLLEEN